MPKRLFIFALNSATGRVFDLRQGLPPLPRPELAIAAGATAPSSHVCAAVAPDQSYAVLTGSSTAYLLREPPAFTSYASPPLPFTGTVYCCAASNAYYAIGGSSPCLMVFAAATGAPQVAPVTGLGSVMGLAFSADGTRLAVSHTASPYLRLYNTADWSAINAGAAAGGGSTYATGVCFTPDGASVAVFAYNSPYISVFDAATGTRSYTNTASTWELPSTGTYSTRIALCPDGKTVVFLLASAPYVAKFDLATNTPMLFTAAAPAIGSPISLWVDPDPAADAVYVTHTSSSALPPRFITKFNISTGTVCADQDGAALTLPYSNATAIAGICTAAHQITGTVRDVDNAPAARIVRAFERAGGRLMAQTVSDADTGDYTLKVYDSGPYDVQFMSAEGELINDLFYARAAPEPVGN